MQMVIVFLTCENLEQANKISSSLLDKKLVACSKKVTVSSNFWWEGKKDRTDEILVMYETIDEKFELIEREVAKLHSYQTPMLLSIPVQNTTEKVKKWLEEEIG